jgi:peptide-methionine (S)-S-oxide reductase
MNDKQRMAAVYSKDKQQRKYESPIVTEILPAKEWYAAETYHQKYLEKGGQCSAKGDLTPIRCYG